VRSAAAILTALVLALAAATPARAGRTVAADGVGNLHAFLVGADGRLYEA
jgi:hypothetical protein